MLQRILILAAIPAALCAQSTITPNPGEPLPIKPPCTASRTTNCTPVADSTGAVSMPGTLSVGSTVLSPTTGVAVNGIGIAQYQQITQYHPQSPYNGPIPTAKLVAYYDLTGTSAGLAVDATSVTNQVGGKPALTLVGTPTINATNITFSGGTQYAVTASTLSDIGLNGHWTVIAVVNQTGTAANKGLLSLGGNGDDTHYDVLYSTAGGTATKSIGTFQSRSAGTINYGGTMYNAPSGTVGVVMLSSDATNTYYTRLDTGGYGFVTNAAATATAPRLGIGVDIRSSAFNITDNLVAYYVFAWNRILTPLEQSNVYGWVTNQLLNKGVLTSTPMSQFRRPQLSTVTLPDNGLDRTPEMGWSSWYAYGNNVTDALVRANCAVLVSSGLAAKGYRYCNTDGGWAARLRDSNGNIVSNTSTFPDMNALGNYIHGLGLKYGLYTSVGPYTCDGSTMGSYTHEVQDAAQFASWGTDFLKHDWCADVDPYFDDPTYWESLATQTNGGGMALTTYIPRFQATYNLMAAALRMTGRPIVLNIASGPLSASTPYTWGQAAGGNSWRLGIDIGSGFASQWLGVVNAFDQQASGASAAYANPGHWNDPDNLLVGNLLTDAEGQTQFSLWAILAAPLIVGADLTAATPATLATLGNTDVIAVNQDALGIQGKQVSSVVCGGATCQVWARQITGTNTCAIGAFNLDSAAHDITITFATVASAVAACGSGPYTTTRDLWAHSSLGTLTTSYTATAVPAHGVFMMRVAP